MNEDGFHLPVVEAHLNYKRPAKFDDIVEIKASIKTKPSVKVKVEYEMYANGVLLVSGYTMHVFVNREGLPVRPPKEVLATLLKAFGQNEQ